MAAVSVCCRTDEKTKRFTLNDVDVKGLVSSFRDKVCQLTSISKDDLELIYCGRLLHDSSTLGHYGIKNGATVHVFRRQTPMSTENKAHAAVGSATVNELITTLQKYMKRVEVKQALETLLTSSDVTKKLTNIEELQNDPVALSILTEPSVLSVISDSPENIRKAAEQHPGLVQAVKQIMEMAAKEATSSRLAGLDVEEETLGAMPSRARQPRQGQSPSTITASQLSAALAAAAAATSVSRSPVVPSAGSSGASVSDQATSNDQMRRVFQSHAVQQAALAAQSFDQQVHTLLGMGIQNETVARNALQQTGGNIDAALDLIFGDSGI